MTRCLAGVAVVAAVIATTAGGAAQKAAAPTDLDSLLAPIALYPDQLLGPMLICAGNPGKVAAFDEWIRSQTARGSGLQAAVTRGGFEDCHAALVLFPEVVSWMASQSPWMSKVGTAFLNDRSAVFASIQRLRGKAHAAGTLKSTPQQTVETKQTSSGEQVIVIEPANPQIVYVPQYNPQVVYTAPATTSTVVIKEESSGANAAVAGMIGFTAGIAIGAAFDNDYYYGPYGYRGGYMYNDAWDDLYDHREDAREDWQDHREDMADEYGDRAKNAQENRTDRRDNTSQQRTERQDNRQSNGSTTGTQAQTQTQTRTAGASQESRGFSGDNASVDRSGTKSDAFSGYSKGSSERAASSRGKSSRSSSSRSSGSRRR